MTNSSYVNSLMAAHVSCHFFSDDSGVVFFNQLTGETLGLALSFEAFIGLYQSKSYLDVLDADVIRQLDTMLATPLLTVERSNDAHLDT